MFTPRRAWLCRAACFFLFVSISSVSLFADTLSGRILDPQGKRVAQAELRLFERKSRESRTMLSSAEGEFVFRDLAPGDYLLEADASAGALTALKEISVRGDQNADVTLEISGKTYEIAVTASNTAAAAEEIAKSVDVINAAEIALRDELSIGESVRNLPGIRVKQNEGPGSFTTIRSRGLRNQDTALLVDGMRFRDAGSPQADATAFLEDMTVVDTDRIEFMRGSGSSLYGSNALAGILNIASRTGGGRTHGEFRAEGGGLGMIRTVAGVGGGLAADRFTYSGSASHLNVTKGVRDGMIYRNSSTQGSAKYTFAPGLSVTGRLWWGNGYVATTESPAFTPAILANFPATGPVPAIALPTSQLERFERRQPFDAGNATFIPGQIDPDGRRASDFLTGVVTIEHQISPGTSYRVAYSGVSTMRKHLNGPAGPGAFEPAFPNVSKFNGRTDSIQARLDQRAGSHNLLTAGYEFERETYFSFSTDNSPTPPVNSTDLEQKNHAVFAQDQIRLVDGRLLLNVGGRAQHFTLTTPEFSGSTLSPYAGVAIDTTNAYTGDAAAAYFFRGTHTKLRAHAGNSFRSPSPYERFGGSFSSFSRSFSYYGDPRLKPERAIAVDGGIDQWLLDSKLQLAGTWFYTDLRETIVFDFATFPAATDPFKRFGGYRNGTDLVTGKHGAGIARGVELSGQIAPTANTHLRAAYTYTNSDSRTPTISPNFYKAPGLSDHMFTFTVTQWIANRFNVTFDLFAAGKYSLSPFGAAGRRLVFDGPVKADAVFSYTLSVGERKVEVYGKIENIFNRHYYEDGFLSPSAWAIGGLRFRM